MPAAKYSATALSSYVRLNPWRIVNHDNGQGFPARFPNVSLASCAARVWAEGRFTKNLKVDSERSIVYVNVR